MGLRGFLSSVLGVRLESLQRVGRKYEIAVRGRRSSADSLSRLADGSCTSDGLLSLVLAVYNLGEETMEEKINSAGGSACSGDLRHRGRAATGRRALEGKRGRLDALIGRSGSCVRAQ